MSPIVIFPDSTIDQEQQQPFTMDEEVLVLDEDEEVEARHTMMPSHYTLNAYSSENNHNSPEEQGRMSIRISFPVLIAAFAILSLLNFASFYQHGREARKLANDSLSQERYFLRTPVQLPQMELELELELDMQGEEGRQEEKDLFSMYPKCDSPLLKQIGNQICNLELNVPECNFDEGDCQQVTVSEN